jgi:hypothetical protein
MPNEAMLGEVSTKSYGGGVTVPDPEIDIRYCAVKSRGAGIIDGLARTGEVVDEPKHIFGLAFIIRVGGLEAGRVFPEKEERAVFTIAYQPDGGRDKNRLRQQIFSFGNEKDAEIVPGLDFADGGLKGVGDIGGAVGFDIEFIRGEIDSRGVFGAKGEDGAAGLGGGSGQEGEQQSDNNNDYMARPFHLVKSNGQPHRPFF